MLLFENKFNYRSSNIGFLLVCLIFFLSGCSSVKDITKYNLSDGYYTSGLIKFREKVYIKNNEDTLIVYPIAQKKDSLKLLIVLPSNSILPVANFYCHRKSLDIDFITIPFIYRPSINDFPMQLNAFLNGAVYVGLRDDLYRVNYKMDYFKNYKRYIDHFGFSAGGFAGIGGTVINPHVTNGYTAYEYDGVIFSKGVAGIIGINNFTLGLAIGFDNLLDSNNKFWIYNNKSWIGLAFGLNLN